MKTTRITVTLPEYIYKTLNSLVGNGQVSNFVANALEEKLLKQKLNGSHPVDDFFNLRKKLPEVESEKIIQAIEKGRQ